MNIINSQNRQEIDESLHTDELQEENTKLKATIDEMSATTGPLDQQLSKMEEEKRNLEVEKQNLEIAVRTKQKALQSVKRSKGRLDKKLKGLHKTQHKNKLLGRDPIQLRKTLRDIQEESEVSTTLFHEEREALVKEKQELQSIIDNLTSQVQNIEEEKGELQRQLEVMKASLALEQSKVQTELQNANLASEKQAASDSRVQELQKQSEAWGQKAAQHLDLLVDCEIGDDAESTTTAPRGHEIRVFCPKPPKLGLIRSAKAQVLAEQNNEIEKQKAAATEEKWKTSESHRNALQVQWEEEREANAKKLEDSQLQVKMLQRQLEGEMTEACLEQC
ncbi:hypothetical protein GGU11DRAFT_750853 [Lentinula aff. detonsa]|nr:hypothetical protein GGU11DRAFT_750853 [Lentinula aff. detonsa]